MQPPWPKSIICEVFDSLQAGQPLDPGHSEILTVGNLWKSLHELAKGNEAEYGPREEKMQVLIARVALAEYVDRRAIINMPLAQFDRLVKSHSLHPPKPAKDE